MANIKLIKDYNNKNMTVLKFAQHPTMSCADRDYDFFVIVIKEGNTYKLLSNCYNVLDTYRHPSNRRNLFNTQFHDGYNSQYSLKEYKERCIDSLNGYGYPEYPFDTDDVELNNALKIIFNGHPYEFV